MITQTVRNISRFALIITMLATLVGVTGCASAPITDEPTRVSSTPAERVKPVARQSVAQRAAATALNQVGVPYRYGGSSRAGFDCSGLVQFSYGKAGKMIPRTTGQLWSSTATVPRDQIEVGDLLFFRIEGKMQHVGLYIGDQKFVHAPSSGRTVSVATLTSPYYSAAFLRAGRPR